MGVVTVPEFRFSVTDFASVSTTTIAGQAVPTVFRGRDGVWLHRPGPDPLRFDRRARSLASGVVTTRATPMSGLSEVFGVAVSAEWPGGTDAAAACGLQVSLNGGATFLAWTGAAWEAQAADGTFNSVGDFNDHCAALTPANPISLAFRVQLSASVGISPLLRHVAAYLEWTSDAAVDVDGREELPVEVARGEAEVGPPVALDDGAEVARAQRGHRPLHAVGAVVVGGEGQRPGAELLMI